MKKFEVIIDAEIKTFDRRKVTFECESKEELEKILNNGNEWIKHYKEMAVIDYLTECDEDTGYYEPDFDYIEEITPADNIEDFDIEKDR